MKQVLFTIMGVAVILIVSCNGDGTDKAAAKTTTITENDQSLPVDAGQARLLQQSRQRLRRLFAADKSIDTSAWSGPLQADFARSYVHSFDTAAQKIETAMGYEISRTFFFNDTTLKAFAQLYAAGEINGIRVYMAKYNNNNVDLRNTGLTRFTVIMVGTKDTTVNGITYPKDKFIPSPLNQELMSSIQDYTNPCTPTPTHPCLGATLIP